MQPRERVDVLFSLRGESLIKKTCDLQQLLTAPAEKRLIVVIRQELDSNIFNQKHHECDL